MAAVWSRDDMLLLLYQYLHHIPEKVYKNHNLEEERSWGGHPFFASLGCSSSTQEQVTVQKTLIQDRRCLAVVGLQHLLDLLIPRVIFVV